MMKSLFSKKIKKEKSKNADLSSANEFVANNIISEMSKYLNESTYDKQFVVNAINQAITELSNEDVELAKAISSAFKSKFKEIDNQFPFKEVIENTAS
jgi:uncharacterized protein